MATADFRILQAKLDLLNERKEEFERAAKPFIQNKHFILRERWRLFIDGGLGRVGWYTEFESLERYFGRPVDWVKDFGIEKHHRVDAQDLFNRAEEEIDDENVLNAFKAEILEKYIRSFKYDW